MGVSPSGGLNSDVADGVRAWWDPVWRKSPLLSLRFPVVGATTLLAAAVLAAVASSRPLFVAGAGNAVIRDELQELTDEAAGLTVSGYGEVFPGSFGDADRRLREAAGKVGASSGSGDRGTLGPVLTAGRLSLLSSQGVDVSLPPPAGKRSAGRRSAQPPTFDARLVSSTNALQNIVPVWAARSHAGRESGFWVPDTLAEQMGLEIDDSELFVTWNLRTGTVQVAGVYRAVELPVSSYWRPLEFLFRPRQVRGGEATSPLPVLVGSRDDFLAYAFDTSDPAETRWSFPLGRRDLSIDAARNVVGDLNRLERSLLSPDTELYDLLTQAGEFSQLDVDSELPAAVSSADQTVVALSVPVRVVGYAGQALAFAVVAAAAVYRVGRRRVEMTALAVRGAGPVGQGMRAALEALMPVAVGTAVGWLAARVLMSALGPAPIHSGQAGQQSVAAAVAVGAGAVALAAGATMSAVTLTTGGQNRLRERSHGGIAAGAARLPWETAVLALAAAAYYQLRLRGSALAVGGAEIGGGAAGREVQVDVLVVLFPLLFLCGGVGLAVRLLRGRLAARGRTASSSGIRRSIDFGATGSGGWSMPLWLAAHRAAGALSGALLLVAVAAVAVGLLV